MFLCSKNTNNIKSEVLPNASLFIFPGCSLIGRSHQANHSASPAKRYLRWYFYIQVLIYGYNVL